MRTRILSLLFSFICLVVASVASAVPNLISYQGVLNDKDGVPLSRTVSMTFTFFDALTNGNALWNESQSVLVEGGLFNVQLGSVQQLTSAVFASDTVYLGIQVGADAEMVPRQRITAGPYVPAVIPVGTIMAWAKDLTGVPSLADGWVECNGQTLDDTKSPLNGQIIPNLNGENRYLRGNTSAGNATGSETHTHYSPLSWRYGTDVKIFGGFGRTLQKTPPLQHHNSVVDSTGSALEFGPLTSFNSNLDFYVYNTSESDSKPPSYDIVWIMKIK